VTDVFELPGSRKAATEIEIKSDLNNNWMALNIALINEQTAEAFDFGKELSNYSGVDDGEKWSEGSKDTTVTIPEVPPGRYYLRIEPDKEKQSDETKTAFAKPIKYAIIVRHDVPAVGMFFLVLFLLLIPPVWGSYRRWSFEQTRWAESDYASSGSSSSDSGDSD